MNIEGIFHGLFVAAMLFIIIVMTMIGLSEYQPGAPRPGRVAMLPDHFSTEGARTAHNPLYEGGLPQKEIPWK